MMGLVKLVLTAVLLLTSVVCQDMDVDSWRGDIEENKWPNSGVIQNIFLRATRKPGPRQYVGLTGKTDSAKSHHARRRHKFHTFVGLMGKRSFEDKGAL